MKRTILGILAVMLAVGLFTQAEAADPLGVGETIQAGVENNLTMRYKDHHITKGPYLPDTIEVTEAGTVLATFNVRLGESPDYFAFYFDGDFDNRLPQSKPFNVAIPPQETQQIGMTYKIAVEFGLGEPLVVITPGRQIWYWGPVCHWAGCNEIGEGPFPPGDWHAQAGYQSVGPEAFGEDLKGCNSVLKPGNNEPLVCIERGWKPPVE